MMCGTLIVAIQDICVAIDRSWFLSITSEVVSGVVTFGNGRKAKIVGK